MEEEARSVDGFIKDEVRSVIEQVLRVSKAASIIPTEQTAIKTSMNRAVDSLRHLFTAEEFAQIVR